MKKSKTDNRYKELEIISDEAIDFINKYAEPHVVSDEYKNTEIFQNTETEDSTGEEFSIISDEVLDFITNNAKRHVISDKNKGRRLFLELSEKEKISREEIQRICDSIDNEDSENSNKRTSTPYTGTQNNETGVIRDVAIEDLNIFYEPKGEK
jgi:beta-N-acetylglucosaminidase